MKIEIQESAKKDLKKLDKPIALKILQEIKKLESFPDSPNTKKLKNHQPPFRHRISDYRVLFDIQDQIIIVFHIRHRSKAYD